MKTFRLAIIGAGAIGRIHIEEALKHDSCDLVAIVDPSDAGKALAAKAGVRCFGDYKAMLTEIKPQGVIVATPNSTHLEIGTFCFDSGAVVLMEKPISDTVESARKLCEVAERCKLPLLVGHHRRHNPILRRAREIMQSGKLGSLVSATVLATWLKPDEYYEMAWRRSKGGGPVLINMIHEIDTLRFLMGEIESVQAASANKARGFEVEDTAAVILRFRNGALATISVSDAATTPWNWDLAAGEADHYPMQTVNTHFISGKTGSLSLPLLEVWDYRGKKGWHQPLTEERAAIHTGSPYAEQLRHFQAVVAGDEQPVSSGRDGLRTLEATLAVHEAARLQSPVVLIE